MSTAYVQFSFPESQWTSSLFTVLLSNFLILLFGKLFPPAYLLFLAREMLGFATSNLKIQRKVKKHEWLNLSRLIETAMFSRNIKGLFPYYQFEMDVNSSPSNPREEA